MRAATVLSIAAAALAVALLALPKTARAYDPFLVVPPAEIVEASAAYRYANMTGEQALAELDRRHVLYQRVDPIGRVETPIRLTGKLHGVHIHSALPESERPTTPFELCDARLALALDDFAEILARHDVVELVHFTMYRAAAGARAQRLANPLPSSGASKRRRGSHGVAPSKHARSSGPSRPADPRRQAIATSRHPDGLAIDVGSLRTSKGEWLQIGADFHGRVGVPSCGPRAHVPSEPKAQALWSILCEVNDAKVFTYVLSPNFDLRHQDHFHMEIKPEVRWFLIH